MTDDVRPGDPRRLGAHPTPEGTTFAVFSSAGQYGGAVELSLLDEFGAERRLPMRSEQDVWTCMVSDVGPGQRYGFRASGPFDPSQGLRFDPGTLLLDPYARAMTPVDPARPRLLHSVVADTSFDWADDRPPGRPWADTVLYETHIKGITATHPDVPERLRGTYAGMAHPAVLDHLTALGVTTVEMMPVHQFLPEPRLLDLGLTNYWGYSTIGFFAPHASYSASGSTGGQVTEFKQMVKTMHAAGLEVILDVVFNHTAEGSAEQPALAFRGLANEVYYRLQPGDASRYVDTTGTGNMVDIGRPEVLRLVADSLRYWVSEMHVDGFRFDLAATLARQHGYVDLLSAFFHLLYQDPVLGSVKLIAEPWDVNAPDSYQVGRFPLGWNEWNDRYRDTVRDFWRGRTAPADLATRLAGSSDLFSARRGPDASVNFVTAHDGKTLTDMLTYAGKYNQANGEDNRDGAPDDHADNYGVEGPTDDPEVNALRGRLRRNMLATLLLSQGTPMICGGDEIHRTQHGNNNAYCQDSPLSWYDWSKVEDARDTIAFVGALVRLQMAHPALRRRTFLTGERGPSALPDVGWFGVDGETVADGAWTDPTNHFLGCLFAGDRTGSLDQAGSSVEDDDVLILLNAGEEDAVVPLPGRAGTRYMVALDTATPDGSPRPETAGEIAAGDKLAIGARTVVVATAPIVR